MYSLPLKSEKKQSLELIFLPALITAAKHEGEHIHAMFRLIPQDADGKRRLKLPFIEHDGEGTLCILNGRKPEELEERLIEVLVEKNRLFHYGARFVGGTVISDNTAGRYVRGTYEYDVAEVRKILYNAE